ncbi:radical SAM protein [Niastella caeni]|uniref:Radical SAM protein n=1 Tax=Niastella caeni TaxID=2569763 RepID=A0A4S8I2Z1_9BACT|nr:radical SAM protein [Niastella caeni]THU40342.1 radical SAM protein [Niastella caeni]
MKRVTCFVLKSASRCNLNCSYCYMYNLGDTTYKDQPKYMSLDTVTALAKRLHSYGQAASIRRMQIVFHGGEPLLLGREYFESCLAIFKNEAPGISFSFIVQTNGVNLDQTWYEWMKVHNVKVGISIDGPQQYHDAFRVFHNGKGSYVQVARAVRQGIGNGLMGILSVLNLRIPAREYYEEMKNLGIESLNLLFPDGHYDRLPEGMAPEQLDDDDYTPFANWLIELFLLWKNDKQRPAIKLFENLLQILLGDEHIGNQAFGLQTNGVLIIETNGAIEVADSLRACYEGITRNHFNVHSHGIEDIFGDRVFDVYYHSHEMVCEKCLNCPVYEFCGGGFLGNRFANKNGFDNPTIYCRDIIRLISFLQNDLINGLPYDAARNSGIEKVSFEEILQELKKAPDITISSSLKQKLTSFKQPDLLCN